jgi:polyphenol oxidase
MPSDARPNDGMTGWPGDWLVPDWPAPPGVHALFTTRAGGVSRPPFDGCNLGDHVRDDPQAVAANRQRLRNLLGGVRPVFLQQVHGTDVLHLQPNTPDGAVADACVGTAPGLACTVMVADCLPVLLAHRSVPVVAAAHAGWRGLVGAQPATSGSAAGHSTGQGVLEATLAALIQAVQRQDAGVSAAQAVADTVAWLGPCIGPDAFEVGTEVRAVFVSASPADVAGFKAQPHGKYLANLPWLARQRLQRLGLTSLHGNDGTPGWCTVSQPLRFFSHRRDAVGGSSTGRMAACVWLA